MHTNAQKHTHIYRHTYIYIYIQINTHTHTHTHTPLVKVLARSSYQSIQDSPPLVLCPDEVEISDPQAAANSHKTIWDKWAWMSAYVHMWERDGKNRQSYKHFTKWKRKPPPPFILHITRMPKCESSLNLVFIPEGSGYQADLASRIDSKDTTGRNPYC